MNRTIVIGGGVSGLSAGYLLGGQVIAMSIAAPIDPFYIHHHAATEKILESLGLNKRVRIATIGYIWKNELYEDPTEEMALSYSERAHGGSRKATTMNDGRSAFRYYDVSGHELVNALLSRAQIVYGTLKEIDVVEHRIALGDGEIIHYDRLVLTIPYNVIAIMLGLAYVQTLPVFRSVIWRPETIPLVSSHAFYYCCDDSYPWFRYVPRFSDGGICESVVGELRDLAYFRPVTEPIIEDVPKDIHLLGRHAQMKQVRYHDVLTRIELLRCQIS